MNLFFLSRCAASEYQRGVSGASACKFLVWEDAFAYYSASYEAGHVRISNATAERRIRGTDRGPGSADDPIFVPSATSTPVRPGQTENNPLVTPTRLTGNLANPVTPQHQTGSPFHPILVPSAAPTPKAVPDLGRAQALPGPPDESSPSFRRFLVIKAALEEAKETATQDMPASSQAKPSLSLVMPPSTQPRYKPGFGAKTKVVKGKARSRFVVTNDDEDDDDTITGYFATENSEAGPSRLA